jgi:hypothetical protein
MILKISIFIGHKYKDGVTEMKEMINLNDKFNCH